MTLTDFSESDWESKFRISIRLLKVIFGLSINSKIILMRKKHSMMYYEFYKKG